MNNKTKWEERLKTLLESIDGSDINDSYQITDNGKEDIKQFISSLINELKEEHKKELQKIKDDLINLGYGFDLSPKEIIEYFNKYIK